MKAVRFDKYGGIEVLQIADVPMPEPSRGEALVKVKAASINPGEAKIREGLMHAMWPATFPSGEGSDLAGIVTKLGLGVDSFAVGAEVIGFTDQRASHAEYVLVEAQNLTIKPAKVSWEVAGSLAVAGSTAPAWILFEIACRLSSGTVNRTLIGCSCVITTRPLASPGVT